MSAQQAAAKASWKGSGDAGTGETWFRIADAHGATRFEGYSVLDVRDEPILAMVRDGAEIKTAGAGESVELVFARTPFYAESGGQAGDRGLIRAKGAEARVRDVVKRAGGLHVHIAEVLSGTLTTGDRVDLEVDGERRRRVMANHSATHLLHAALRRVLGEHVMQKGSLVEADRLRFDFSHGAPVTDAEIEAIEAEVNAVIRQNADTEIRVTSPDEAIRAGALALFGEKYGDEVRVLTMGEGLEDRARAYSVELCGGTHVKRTGDIAVFVVTSESGVSAGVRRIEAATGAEALDVLKGEARVARDAAARLKVPLRDVDSRLGKLLDERRQLESQLGEAKKQLAMGGGSGPAASGPETIGEVKFIGRVAQGVAAKDLRGLIDEAKTSLGSGVAVFVAVNEGKAAVAVGVTDDLTARFSAVELVRVAAAAVGGKGGGGRADMAQAGGPDGDKADEAVAAVRAVLSGG